MDIRRLLGLSLILTSTMALTSNTPPNSRHPVQLSSSTASAANSMGFTTVQKENYDIVKVDLDDGRDYPIYIGTGYSDAEGT